MDIITASHITSDSRLNVLKNLMISIIATCNNIDFKHRISISCSEEMENSSLMESLESQDERFIFYKQDEKMTQEQHLTFLLEKMEEENVDNKRKVMFIDDDDMILHFSPKWLKYPAIKGNHMVLDIEKMEFDYALKYSDISFFEFVKSFEEDLLEKNIYILHGYPEIEWSYAYDFSGYICSFNDAKQALEYSKNNEVVLNIFNDIMNYIDNIEGILYSPVFIYHRLLMEKKEWVANLKEDIDNITL